MCNSSVDKASGTANETGKKCTALNMEPELARGYILQAREAIDALLSELDGAAAEVGGEEEEEIMERVRRDVVRGVVALQRLRDAAG